MMTSFLQALKKESPLTYVMVSLLVGFGSAGAVGNGNLTNSLGDLEASVDELGDDLDHLRSRLDTNTTQLQLIELQLDDLPPLAAKNEDQEQRIATLESRIAVLEAFQERR